MHSSLNDTKEENPIYTRTVSTHTTKFEETGFKSDDWNQHGAPFYIEKRA